MSQPLYRDGHGYLLDKRDGLVRFEMKSGKKVWDDGNRMTPKGRNPQATLAWAGDGDRASILNSDGVSDLGPAHSAVTRNRRERTSSRPPGAPGVCGRLCLRAQ